VAGRLGGINAITLFVADPARSRAFYEKVLGGRVMFEDADSVVFDAGNTMLNLLAAAEAPELITPATVATPDAPARSVFSFFVEDVDAECAHLVEAGIQLLNGPVDRPWGKRTAAFADPDGTIWEVAQDLPR
jgi:catechol 2,3-dioxygenase-like lactoylglutathione lyase family enzyme